MKPKYNIGDVIYYASELMIKEGIIQAVAIREGKFCYSIDKIISPHWAIYFTITEDRLFSTPKELINNFTQLIQNNETNKQAESRKRNHKANDSRAYRV